MAPATGNPNDLIRRQMLQYFYDRNSQATSQRGKKGSAVKISDVKADLKQRHGLSQQQVMANLTYLIDRGWVKTIEESKSFTAPRGTTVPSVTTYFQISAQGIEKIEGESEFQPRDRYAGIKIAATGESVVTVGDGNVVNVRNQGLFQQLNELKDRIIESDVVPEETKLDVAVDIETLKTQLAKHDPDRQVVERLWERIAKVADVASLAGLVVAIEPGVRQLLGG
jgi:hypothetical protein